MRHFEEIEWTDEDEAAADRAMAELAAEAEQHAAPPEIGDVRAGSAMPLEDATPPDPADDPDWPICRNQFTDADVARLQAAHAELDRFLQRLPALLREMEDEDRRERQEREQRRQRRLRAMVLQAVRRTQPYRR